MFQEEPRASQRVERDPEPREPEVNYEKSFEPKRVIEDVEKGASNSDKTSKSFFMMPIVGTW